MKCGPTEINSSMNAKLAPSDSPQMSLTDLTITVFDLPGELLDEIFNQDLTLDDLVILRMVNKAFKTHVDSSYQGYINKFYSYLRSRHQQTYNDNPLMLGYQELNFYEKHYPKIEMSDILSALIGDVEQIKLVKDEAAKITLYSLAFAKGHQIPELVEDDSDYDLHLPSRIFVAAVSMGNLNLVKEYAPSALEPAWIDANWNAVARGDIGIVKYITVQSSDVVLDQDFKKHMFNDAIVGAARIGNMEIFKFLGEEMDNDTCIRPLQAAASNGHAEIVNLIFTTFVIERRYKYEALTKALENGYLDLAKDLYQRFTNDIENASNGQLTSPELALIAVNQSNEIENIKNAMKQSLKGAAGNGQAHIIDYLLSTHEFNSDEINQAVYEAIQFGKLKVIKMLLPQFTGDHSELVEYAEQQNQLRSLQLLAREAHAHNKALWTAFIKISTKVDCDIISILSTLEPIKIKEILSITLNEGRNLQVFKFFLTKAKESKDNCLINTEDQYDLLKMAVDNYQLKMVELLLENIRWDKYKDIRQRVLKDLDHLYFVDAIKLVIKDNIEADEPFTVSDNVFYVFEVAKTTYTNAYNMLTSNPTNSNSQRLSTRSVSQTAAGVYRRI
jgi:hypothetical protein